MRVFDDFCSHAINHIRLSVGYDEAGILTESIRRRPYQILLLDEFEKAHRDVWNIFLQVSHFHARQTFWQLA